MKKNTTTTYYTGYERIRYNELMLFMDELASAYGFVTYRPDYHRAKGDKNTVLFYTKEDAKHNREVDKEHVSYSASEAFDAKKYHGVHIDEKYVYRNHFWAYESTDANGMLDFNFANFGKVDLSGRDWRKRLAGAILLPFYKRQQSEYTRCCGGFDGIHEADNAYNDFNRKIIEAFSWLHGKAYLGNINFFDDKKRAAVAAGTESVYEEYSGEDVYNFSCVFVVPTKDNELELLIRLWNKSDEAVSYELVTKITERIEKIGGINLLWY